MVPPAEPGDGLPEAERTHLAVIVYTYDDGRAEVQVMARSSLERCARLCDMVPGVVTSDPTLVEAAWYVWTRDQFIEATGTEPPEPGQPVAQGSGE